MSQLWKMHKGHSKAKEDKYNDKYMEWDKDKDRQRQESGE